MLLMTAALTLYKTFRCFAAGPVGNDPAGGVNRWAGRFAGFFASFMSTTSLPGSAWDTGARTLMFDLLSEASAWAQQLL